MFDTSSMSSESPMAACNDDAQPLESSVNHEDMSQQAIREYEQVEEPIEDQEEEPIEAQVEEPEDLLEDPVEGQIEDEIDGKEQDFLEEEQGQNEEKEENQEFDIERIQPSIVEDIDEDARMSSPTITSTPKTYPYNTRFMYIYFI